MTRLSINLNKIALLRNSRPNGIPSVVKSARDAIRAGAQGITVHPRPDQRHIRISDVYELASLLRAHPEVELNVEGNPFPEYMELVRAVRPAQSTLVPDSVGALTSDHGWELGRDAERLAPIVRELRDLDVRVSLFMNADGNCWKTARELGADRVELYTEPYAAAFTRGEYSETLARFSKAALMAQSEGLGVNAGHDLNLLNLGPFRRAVPGLLEVSIGHALVADALEMGLGSAVRAYLQALTV